MPLRIWIGNYVRGDWNGMWAHNALSFTKHSPQFPDIPAEVPNTQAASYVVGQLYVHVLSSSIDGIVDLWRFDARANTVLRAIWPPTNSPIEWPPVDTMTDRDADNIAGAFGLFVDSLSGR